MQHHDPNVLARELGADPSFVETTIGLDRGRLLKSATHIYFIAERMGGWEVVEQTQFSDIARIERIQNFMGENTVVMTKNGRWTCKDVTEGIDLRRWVGTKALVNDQQARVVESVKKHLQSPTPSLSNPTNDDTDSLLASLSTSESIESKEDDDFDDVDDIDDVDDLLEPMQPSPPQRLSGNYSSQEPNQEVNDLLAKLEAAKTTTEETEEEPSKGGCGALFWWLFILYVMGNAFDLC